MELKIEKRIAGSKSVLNRIRNEGNIPAILYKKGQTNEAMVVNGPEFQAVLRKTPKGCLATQVLEVSCEGRSFKAIVKDITYHRVTYRIEHIDLMEVRDEDRVSINVPIVCKGEDKCIGITQGGQLKRVKRTMNVSCPVNEIPEAFVLDVVSLALGSSLRVEDVSLTAGMKLGINPRQMLVTVSK